MKVKSNICRTISCYLRRAANLPKRFVLIIVQNPLPGRRSPSCGFSLLGVVALVLLSGVFISVLLVQSNATRKLEITSADRNLAHLYATELAEYFRSFQTGAALNAFLGAHTRTQSGLVPPTAYAFCQDINLLNRSTGLLTRPDSLAALPSTPLDLSDDRGKANRWYQLQIQNVAGTRPTHSSANCPAFGTALNLGPAERVVVLVRVGWLTGEKREPLNVGISTVLPE